MKHLSLSLGKIEGNCVNCKTAGQETRISGQGTLILDGRGLKARQAFLAGEITYDGRNHHKDLSIRRGKNDTHASFNISKAPWGQIGQVLVTTANSSHRFTITNTEFHNYCLSELEKKGTEI